MSFKSKPLYVLCLTPLRSAALPFPRVLCSWPTRRLAVEIEEPQENCAFLEFRLRSGQIAIIFNVHQRRVNVRSLERIGQTSAHYSNDVSFLPGYLLQGKDSRRCPGCFQPKRLDTETHMLTTAMDIRPQGSWS